MDRGEDILTHHALVEHDSVLIVVTLPRHVSHEEVAAECEFAVFSSITLGEDIALLDALAFLANRTKVNGHILVGTAELGNIVDLLGRLEAYELFILRAVVQNADGSSIYELNHAIALGGNHRAGIFADLLFDTRADNRSLGMDKGHGLAHHVRSHQCAVSIVVLQEGNERSGDRGNLLRRNVHKFHFRGRHNGIVGILAAFYFIANEGAIGTKGRIALTDDLAFFFFGREINNVFVLEVYHRIGYLSVRRFDEAEVVDLSIYAERGDKTDVRTFRRLNRAEAAVVGIVYVANLETCTLAGQTAGAEGREAALVRYFCQGVGLVHELRQGVRTEEGVDDARNGLGVDEVGRREHFVIADVHALADCAAHACQTNGKLVGELLAHGADAAVAEVVDIVDGGLAVNQFDEIFDNLNNIFVRQHTHVHIGRKVELVVDAVATHFTQVVTLFREEKVVDDIACAGIVGGVGIAELTIDIKHGLLFRVGGVFLQGVENNGIVGCGSLFVVNENALRTAFNNLLDMVLLENGLTLKHHFVALDRYYFTGIFINKVFYPALQNTCGKAAAKHLFQAGLIHLDFFGEIEYLENVFIGFVTNRTQQGRYGQLLLTVDVSIHHIVDVCSKFNPRTLERYDTCGIELRTICVNARTEEYAGRAVQLRNDYALCAVDDKRTVLGHVRYLTEEHVLHHGIKIFVVRVGAIQFELRLQGHAVRKSYFEALLNAVTGRVDVIIEEL